MSSSLATDDEPVLKPTRSPWQQFASAPLAPVAVAVSLGLLVDRYLTIPTGAGLILASILFASWFGYRSRMDRAIVLLWLALGCLGAEHHHIYCHVFPADDIGLSLRPEPRVLTVRGILADTPSLRRQARPQFTGSPIRDWEIAWVDLTAVQTLDDQWVPVSGRLRVIIQLGEASASVPPAVNAGDQVELIGLATESLAPKNPGEIDRRKRDRDQRIRGELRVASATGIVRLERAEFGITSFFASLRGWATQLLTRELSDQASPTARALLLGDGTILERSEWEAYVRTGVVHVLVISGQHLVVLAAFFWFLGGVLGYPRFQTAWAVLAIILAYTMLTGLRPSSVRAAAMVFSVCGAHVLRRPPQAANSFALAWLIVVALNPTDPFTLGCQLSFLSVFVLIWGIPVWFPPRTPTPMDRLNALFRPKWLAILRSAGLGLAQLYLVNVVLFAVNAPLILADQHVISPIGLLIGPLLVLLTSVALLAGFLLFVLSWVPILGAILAGVAQLALEACRMAVQWADRVPGGSVYAPGLPTFWLIGFAALIAAGVFLHVSHRRAILLASLLGLSSGLLFPTRWNEPDELRMTVLAVGHGCCVVLETPDDRVLLYDVGTLSGPDAVRRVIAPYLWHRGVRRVDEVFLSHADSDHFNNLPELLRRFSVGRVSLTPSFSSKPTAEVAEALLAIQTHRVASDLIVRGERRLAGAVQVDVLHPPLDGPSGSENERSLVLAIRHAGHVLLLTGDLEGAGTREVTSRANEPVDVLLAPHHGSRGAFPAGFRDWAKPRFVIVSRGEGFGTPIQPGDAGPTTPVWDTPSRGAVTVRCHSSGMIVESFPTGERHVLRSRREPSR